MKRFFVLLSLGLLVLMLTACGKNSTDVVASGKPGNATTPQVTTTNAPVNTGEENTTPTSAVTESVDKIDDLTDWDKALGSGSVTVTFSID